MRRFSYKKVSSEAYSLGIDWIYDDVEGGRFIATAEKALCDKIRYDRDIGTLFDLIVPIYNYINKSCRIFETAKIIHTDFKDSEGKAFEAVYKKIKEVLFQKVIGVLK